MDYGEEIIYNKDIYLKIYLGFPIDINFLL